MRIICGRNIITIETHYMPQNVQPINNSIFSHNRNTSMIFFSDVIFLNPVLFCFPFAKKWRKWNFILEGLLWISVLSEQIFLTYHGLIGLVNFEYFCINYTVKVNMNQLMHTVLQNKLDCVITVLQECVYIRPMFSFTSIYSWSHFSSPHVTNPITLVRAQSVLVGSSHYTYITIEISRSLQGCWN